MSEFQRREMQPAAEGSHVLLNVVQHPSMPAEATIDIFVNGYVSFEDASSFVWPSNREYPYYNTVNGHVRSTNWGASGGSVDWLIQVSAEMTFDILVGVLSAYLYDAAKRGKVQAMPPNEVSATDRAIQTVLLRERTLRREQIRVVSYTDDRETGTEIIALAAESLEFRVTMRPLPLNHSVVKFERLRTGGFLESTADRAVG